jgi:hypothetical protein
MESKIQNPQSKIQTFEDRLCRPVGNLNHTEDTHQRTDNHFSHKEKEQYNAKNA